MRFPQEQWALARYRVFTQRVKMVITAKSYKSGPKLANSILTRGFRLCVTPQTYVPQRRRRTPVTRASTLQLQSARNDYSVDAVIPKPRSFTFWSPSCVVIFVPEHKKAPARVHLPEPGSET